MIVLDASTLILLAKTELLQRFLESIGHRVLIPPEVERECFSRAQKSLDARLIGKAIQEKHISVKRLKQVQLYEKIRGDFALGQGEAEAIALAFSVKAKLIGIDDKNGINACKLLELPFTTAINILVVMREKGFIDEETASMKLGALQRHGRYGTEILSAARARLEAIR